jgi:phage protein D
MQLVTLADESKNQRGFYVPQFAVKIENAGLPRDVLRDVIQVTYSDNLKEIDSFELTINNWDSATRSFKYVGSETADSLKRNTPDTALYHLFDPCNKQVTLQLGYLDELQVMTVGNFTTLEPSFPSSGGPTLTVRGLNVLHQLRRKQYTYSWVTKKDSEIAENIATLTDKQTGKKRFPIPIVTDANAKAQETAIDYVAQDNQYDIDFLFQRARLQGYVVVVQEADHVVRGSTHQLYFGPSQSSGTRDVTFQLEWGKSLVEFHPTLTTANQVKSVTVHGWNRNTKQPITEAATLDDPRLNRNKDLFDLLKKCDPREEVVVNEPVFSTKQAKDRAFSILSDRQKEMVKASCTSVGLPDLRAGRKVVIKGVGARFSGTYFVTNTTHTIGNSGYTTKFNARREDDGSATKQ